MTYRTWLRLWAEEIRVNVTTEPWRLVPHPHRPVRVPAGDGWYCSWCGSRSAAVQVKGIRKRESTMRTLA